MKFSVAFSCSSASLASWSPNGRYLAVPDNNKLYIKDGHSAYCLLTSFVCLDAIKVAQWSPDSGLVVTATLSNNSSNTSTSNSAGECGCVEVWSIHDPVWRCHLQPGSAGVASLSWGPDSRHIVTTDLFHLRVTVWSLVSRSSVFVHSVKQPVVGCVVQFSEDGQYMALVDRTNGKDTMLVVETRTWQMVKHFPTATVDLAGFCWGCGGAGGPLVVLAVWDSPLYYAVLLYDVCGRLLKTVRGPEEFSLGVRGAVWTPSGHQLIVGDQQDKLRVVHYMTWEEGPQGEHTELLLGEEGEDTVERLRVYKEGFSDATPATALVAVAGSRNAAYEEELHRPLQLTPCPAPPSPWFTSPHHSPFTPSRLSPGGHRYRGAMRGAVCPVEGVGGGVTAMLCSADGRFLATTSHRHPTVVWVWALPRLVMVAVLVHGSAVRDVSWSPRHPRLAVVTGEATLFLWTSLGALAVTTPRALRLLPAAVRWHPSGNRLLLVGRGGQQFTVCSVGGDAQTGGG